MPVAATSVRELRLRLAKTFLVTFSVLTFVAGIQQIQDPFFQYDDYPALAAIADQYYVKAVVEGRWINYLWHLRELVTPAWFNFQIYNLGWSLFISAAAVNIFRSGSLLYPLLFATLVALGSQTTEMSAWFNTLIPVVWLLAASSLIILFTIEKRGPWVMAAFVPLTLQAYTTYPLFLLAVCLLREDRPRTFVTTYRIVCLFMFAFVFGIALVYLLNYVFAGYFGVEPHAWRNPTPATDLGVLVDNFSKVTSSLQETYQAIGFRNSILSFVILSMFIVSYAVVLRSSKHDAASIFVVIAVGLGLLIFFSLTKGVEFPSRSTSFIWFVLCAALILGARNWQTSRSSKFISPLLPSLGLALCLALLAADVHKGRSNWQSYVRDLASQLPEDATDIYILGSFEDVPRAPDYSRDFDLVFHLSLISEILATDCQVSAELCSNVLSPFEETKPGENPLIRTIDGKTFVLPARYDR